MGRPGFPSSKKPDSKGRPNRPNTVSRLTHRPTSYRSAARSTRSSVSRVSRMSRSSTDLRNSSTGNTTPLHLSSPNTSFSDELEEMAPPRWSTARGGNEKPARPGSSYAKPPPPYASPPKPVSPRYHGHSEQRGGGSSEATVRGSGGSSDHTATGPASRRVSKRRVYKRACNGDRGRRCGCSCHNRRGQRGNKRPRSRLRGAFYRGGFFPTPPSSEDIGEDLSSYHPSVGAMSQDGAGTFGRRVGGIRIARSMQGTSTSDDSVRFNQRRFTK